MLAISIARLDSILSPYLWPSTPACGSPAEVLVMLCRRGTTQIAQHQQQRLGVVHKAAPDVAEAEQPEAEVARAHPLPAVRGDDGESAAVPKKQRWCKAKTVGTCGHGPSY